jgi:hypothetical protein
MARIHIRYHPRGHLTMDRSEVPIEKIPPAFFGGYHRQYLALYKLQECA